VKGTAAGAKTSQKLVATETQKLGNNRGDVCEVFGNRAYTLTLAEAAKPLEELTGAHRTSCYRALKLDGRFARHLRADGTTLTWC
jgi:hypothetical protein